MGLFDWLKPKKKNVEIAADRIWLGKQGKLIGMLRDMNVALADTKEVDALFVVAQFKDCLDELNATVAGSGIDDDRIHLALADALQGGPSPLSVFDDSHRLLFFVGERHPLRSHDEIVVEFARSLPCSSRIVYYTSLEDALLRQFSGEWVEGVLKRLGMKEDEVIESQMVSRRVGGAQKKIADVAISDLPAHSAEEWFRQNCPTM